MLDGLSCQTGLGIEHSLNLDILFALGDDDIHGKLEELTVVPGKMGVRIC